MPTEPVMVGNEKEEGPIFQPTTRRAAMAISGKPFRSSKQLTNQREKLHVACPRKFYGRA